MDTRCMQFVCKLKSLVIINRFFTAFDIMKFTYITNSK